MNRPVPSSLFPDTPKDAQRRLLELLRQAPPWRTFQLVGSLNQTVKTLALSGLRQQYPLATAEELRRHLAERLLGSELALQAYGPLIRRGAQGAS